MGVDPSLTISRHVQRAAHQTPTACALLDGPLQFSYDELHAYVQRLAHQLAAEHPADAAPVAIVGHLDAWTIAGMLGVLWSGRTLSVLDGNLPAERLQQLLEQLQPEMLLGSKPLPPLSGDSSRLTQLDLRTIERTTPPETVPPRDQLHTPAIVTYSSGTSGRPKGVVRSQAVLLQHLAAYSSAAPPQPGDHVALLHHPAFSSAGADIYPTLFGGATIQIIDPSSLTAAQLRDRLISAELTHLHLRGFLLRPLADSLPHDHRFTRMRAIRPSEHTDGADVARFARHLPADCIVSHTLSSSETGPISLFQRRAGADWPPGLLPVGRPLPGITVRLLDEHGDPVAPGAIGRIEVSGPGIALGYWRDAERTNEVFFTADDPSVRTFRSNDLACLLPSGELQLHGRADRRVKIRGHSVALDVLEQALHALPGVAAAAAVALPDRAGNLRLFAYISPQPDAVCDPLHLAALLRDQHEAALQPQRIIVLEQLPRRANGKIDYQALPPPEQARPDLAVPFVAPATPLEQQIAAVWADVLELDTVGLDDPFMLLGGDSIRALHLLHRLESVIGRRLPTNLLIAAATVRQQAALAAQSSALTEAAPPAAARQHSRLRGTFRRLLFSALRSIVLLLLAVGLIDRRYRRQRRLLDQLADAYGCRQPRDELWRRSVLVNLLLNKPFFLRPNQFLRRSWSDRYERMTAEALTPICLEGFADLEQAYHTGNGVLLVTYHGAAKAARKLVLGRLLNGHPIQTVSGSRARFAARQHGREIEQRGQAAYHGLAALLRGEVLAFSADHSHQHSRQLWLRFNRHTRPIAGGFAEVALLSKAAILPIRHRCDEHGRVTVMIGTPFQHPDPTLPHEQQITMLLQQYADWLASAIADDPAMLQWRFLPRELELIRDAAKDAGAPEPQQ